MWIRTSEGAMLNMDHATAIAYEPRVDRTVVVMDGKTITVSNGNTLPTITGALRCGKSYLEVNDCER